MNCMKFSPEMIEVLKNFANINSNIVFEVDSAVTTISEAKNILAIGPKPDFNFTQDFGIYDLQEFLSAISMFSEPTFEIDDDYTYMLIKEGKQSIKYFFSSPEFLTHPTKKIKMPSSEVKFTLGERDISKLKQAASTLSADDLVFETGGIVYVTDTKDKTSNSFKIELPNFQVKDDASFKFVMSVSDLKILPDDYEVEISSKFISRFVGKTNNVEYFIGLDNKASNYGD